MPLCLAFQSQWSWNNYGRMNWKFDLETSGAKECFEAASIDPKLSK